MSEPVAPYRVLVVDDDPDMGAYLGLLLKKEGMQADIVENGDAALMRVMTDPPDLLLLDVMMPGRSGFEICQRLKSEEATALIPIVLITGLDDQKSRIQGIEAGADDFLNKPVKREELVARVKTLRRLHDTRKELEGRRLAAEVERKEAIRKTFSRYISPRLADRIMSDADKPGEIFSKAQRSNVVALFADLRGFTRTSSTLDSQVVVDMLNDYFHVLGQEIFRHDGTIDKFIGDAVLAIFGSPEPDQFHAWKAVCAAIEMQARMSVVNARRVAEGLPYCELGIGVYTGEVLHGFIGAEDRMEFTVIGDTVNKASRYCDAAGAGEIVIGPLTQESIAGEIPSTPKLISGKHESNMPAFVVDWKNTGLGS